MNQQGFLDAMAGHLIASSQALRLATRKQIEETLLRIIHIR